MGWLSFVNLLLKVSNGIIRYLEQKKIIDGAQAQIISKGLKGTMGMVNEARKTAKAMRDNSDPDWAERVRRKHRRD